MKKNYEEELEKINKYLEKDKERNKNNPLLNGSATRLSRLDRIKKESKDNVEDDAIDLIDEEEKDVTELIDEEEEKDVTELFNNKKEKKERRTKASEYQPHKKYNIILAISLISFFLFFSLFIISTHSTLLVKKPFNYVSIVLAIIGFITTIVSIVLKITHRDLEKGNHKFNVKLTITTIILSLFMLFMIVLLNVFEFWNYIDIIYVRKKKIFIISLIIIFIFALIFVIRLIRHKRFKDNTRRVLLTLFLICVCSGFTGFIFTLYGPITGFKEWLITTAMPTMDHQKYCKWFYSDAEIEKIMSKNYIVESGESTDKKLITKEETKKYKDEYERQILEHEEGEQYKIIKLEVADMPAYLAAIYDPTMIKVEYTKELGSRGEYVTKMAERNNGILAINGGGFLDPGGSSWGGTPTGITISNGKVITNNEYGLAINSGGVIGFTEDGTLMLLKVNTAKEALNQGVVNAVSWGPFLIVNGISSKISGNGGWGIGARSAIGQRKDGVVLLLVVDSNASRTKGATMGDLTDIMERYGAVNASNLDGGTSSVMVLPKQVAKQNWNAPCTDYFTNAYCAINDPIDSTGTHQTRYIATSFVVLDKNEVTNTTSQY